MVFKNLNQKVQFKLWTTNTPSFLIVCFCFFTPHCVHLFSNLCSTKTRVNVSSYANFQDSLEKYINNTEPVSFNVSKDVDAKSYHDIVELLLDSNLKRDRRDKIKHPRSNHFLLPVVHCETTEKMQNVYNAIGPYWRVVMCANEEENAKLFYQMDEYRMGAGIEDHQSDPLWARA